MNRRLLLSALFLSVAFSAQAARPRPALKLLAPNPFIDVGAEQTVSDEVSYVPAGGASTPRVAVGPLQSLVVWRSNQAVRIGPSGELLDQTPIPLLVPAPFDVKAWDAVWDGTRYVVAVSSYTYPAGEGINLVYVSTAGRVESVRKLDLSLDQFTGFTSIAFAYGKDELALIYDTNDQTHGIEVVRGLLLSPQGNITQRFTLGTTIQSTRDPSFEIVASPTGYLALWSDQAAFVAHATGVVAPAALPVVNVATAAVWNGNAFFVVATGADGVYGFELTAPNVSGPLITIHSSAFGARHPAVAYGGGDYRILWKEAANARQSYYGGVAFGLFTAVVTQAGSVVGAAQLEASTDGTDRYSYEIDPPVVGTGNGSLVIVWTRQLGSSITNFRNAYAAVVRSDETLSPELFATRVQLLTRAAGTPRLLSLVASRAGVQAILGRDEKPVPLMNVVNIGREARTAPVPLSPQISNAYEVLAAWNGVDTTLIWNQPSSGNVSTLWAGEMDQQGKVVSRFPISITNRLSLLSLVCGPADCAAAFATLDGQGSNANQYLQRIAPNGTPLYAAVQPPGSSFTIAPLGSDYLVVMRFQSGLANATTAARLVEGKLSDVTYLVNESTYGVAFVISRGNECLVAIRRQTPAIPNAETDFFRIDLTGNVVGTSKLALPPYTSQVWDGRNWLIAWTQSSASDIVAARIAPDLSHFNVVTLVGAASQPILQNLVSTGDGTSILAYVGRDYDPKYGGTYRTFLRWLDDRM